ncbi:MAG: hypothetical protein WCY12_01270 [Candidatus Omnitrophota bacterium]
MSFRAVFLLSLILIISLSGLRPGFSQDSGAPDPDDGILSPIEVEDALKKAMSRADREKEQKQEELTKKLKLKSEQAKADWIFSQSQKRNSELNRLVDQNWESLFEFGPRIKYDYYLRDYVYSGARVDIVKTSSLVAIHAAHLNAVEKLYVERTHSPNASDRSMFYYTVSTPIKVTFEYDGDNFVVLNIEYGDTSIDEGWPEEIKKKLMLF